jgi:Tfp pilus assembly protein PilN
MSVVEWVYERNIIMSKSTPSTLEERAATVPSHPQQRRKSRRWVWITLGVFALLGVLGVLVVNFTVNPAIAEEQLYWLLGTFVHKIAGLRQYHGPHRPSCF